MLKERAIQLCKPASDQLHRAATQKILLSKFIWEPARSKYITITWPFDLLPIFASITFLCSGNIFYLAALWNWPQLKKPSDPTLNCSHFSVVKGTYIPKSTKATGGDHNTFPMFLVGNHNLEIRSRCSVGGRPFWWFVTMTEKWTMKNSWTPTMAFGDQTCGITDEFRVNGENLIKKGCECYFSMVSCSLVDT